MVWHFLLLMSLFKHESDRASSLGFSYLPWITCNPQFMTAIGTGIAIIRHSSCKARLHHVLAIPAVLVFNGEACRKLQVAGKRLLSGGGGREGMHRGAGKGQGGSI